MSEATNILNNRSLESLITHKFAALSEVRLHYVDAGEGPMVMLLHGFPEFWYSWRYQIPALVNAGYRVIAPDMRGFNLSDKPRGVRHYSLEAITRDVVELFEYLQQPRGVLAGHDWGGAVAWNMAIRHPEFLSQLIVLNAPHPARFLRALQTWRQICKSSYMVAFQLPWLPEAVLRANHFALLRDRLVRDLVHREQITQRDIDLYVQSWSQRRALSSGLNYYRSPNTLLSWRSLPPVSVPTLLIWGMADRYLGAELAELNPSLVERFEVALLPSGSHWIQQDEPERVNQLILKSLRPLNNTSNAGA